MKFNKKQLEKLADQTRLLSWAQGAVVTSTSGLHWSLNSATIAFIISSFIACQVCSLMLDKWSDN